MVTVSIHYQVAEDIADLLEAQSPTPSSGDLYDSDYGNDHNDRMATRTTTAMSMRNVDHSLPQAAKHVGRKPSPTRRPMVSDRKPANVSRSNSSGNIDASESRRNDLLDSELGNFRDLGRKANLSRKRNDRSDVESAGAFSGRTLAGKDELSKGGEGPSFDPEFEKMEAASAVTSRRHQGKADHPMRRELPLGKSFGEAVHPLSTSVMATDISRFCTDHQEFSSRHCGIRGKSRGNHSQSSGTRIYSTS
jgi:hypothetical protein